MFDRAAVRKTSPLLPGSPILLKSGAIMSDIQPMTPRYSNTEIPSVMGMTIFITHTAVSHAGRSALLAAYRKRVIVSLRFIAIELSLKKPTKLRF